MSDSQSWRLERRNDGAILVRVPSMLRGFLPLPEAVFSFRAGDPQYGKWEERLREQDMRGALS